MHILLTNDDGIYSPGIEALYAELSQLGTVDLIAPVVEQSGVSHTITYLQPLIVHDIFRDNRFLGRAVAGSPADCVKLAMLELCSQKPDLVVSGINSGANVGINVLYSGTVAAAIEGAFFGLTSVAVSHSMSDTNPDYPRAAKLAVGLIRQLLDRHPAVGSLWNMNLPETRPDWPLGVKVLPMGVERYREVVERRVDPRGRNYYWCGTDRTVVHPVEPDTDVEGLAEGYITLTPLHFDLTNRRQMTDFQQREWKLSE